MPRLGWIIFLMVCMSTAANAREQEVKSRITSVGLFKNGLAVISRAVTVPASGTYRVEDVPEPVHGTFWIKSDATNTGTITYGVTNSQFAMDRALSIATNTFTCGVSTASTRSSAEVFASDNVVAST